MAVLFGTIRDYLGRFGTICYYVELIWLQKQSIACFLIYVCLQLAEWAQDRPMRAVQRHQTFRGHEPEARPEVAGPNFVSSEASLGTLPCRLSHSEFVNLFN